ncbi:MAG TPA: hypothetical protein VKS24_20270 [Bradyrhizobium sp.]|nr:hypothetical protein [Bradyrhizobium sp.]
MNYDLARVRKQTINVKRLVSAYAGAWQGAERSERGIMPDGQKSRGEPMNQLVHRVPTYRTASMRGCHKEKASGSRLFKPAKESVDLVL